MPGKAFLLAGIAAGVYGGEVFIRQGIFSYMFLRTPFVFFDFGKSLCLVLFDHLAMILFWAGFGCMVKMSEKETAEKIEKPI